MSGLTPLRAVVGIALCAAVLGGVGSLRGGPGDADRDAVWTEPPAPPAQADAQAVLNLMRQTGHFDPIETQAQEGADGTAEADAGPPAPPTVLAIYVKDEAPRVAIRAAPGEARAARTLAVGEQAADGFLLVSAEPGAAAVFERDGLRYRVPLYPQLDALDGPRR